VLDRVPDEIGRRVGADLPVDVRAVGLDRLDADRELLRDLLGRVPLHDELEDLLLARREALEGGPGAPRLEELPRQLGREVALPSRHAANGVEHLVERLILEGVAVGPTVERRVHPIRAGDHRQHQDVRAAEALLELREEAAPAARARVDDHHVHLRVLRPRTDGVAAKSKPCA
jgi:hypothetical protein